MIKLAIINIETRMQKEKFRSGMVLLVHDELVFDTFLEEVDSIMELVKEVMCNVLPLDVPFLVAILSVV